MDRESLIKKLRDIRASLERASDAYKFERDDEAWQELDDAFENLNSLHYKLNEGMPIE